MSAAVAAGLAAAAAALLALRSPQRVVRPAASQETVVPGDHGVLFALRWPLAALALVGGWAFLGGLLGLVAGALAAVWSVHALAAAEGPRARRRRLELARDLPDGVDLLGATIRAGGAVDQGLLLVSSALPGALAAEFVAIHHRLGLGTDPAVVWRELGGHPQLAPLGRAMVRAHESGAPVVEAVAALARQLRDQARFDVEARAKSVDVKSAGPLGLCLLPAFVLIGIVPMVAGIFTATGLFG